MKRLLIALMAVTAFSSAATAQDPTFGGKASGTGRELYIACYLFAADAEIKDQGAVEGYVLPYSPPACLTTALAVMAHAKPNIKSPEYGCYTIKSGPLTSAQWPKEMARAYVKFYEKNSKEVADVMGVTALLTALIIEWPCG